ncbi:hypothetical protein CRENBAI_002244 [Crenichthys baileyi]|uniref:Uncharacterized protein n=1 Tax=Crenichthys baileyi TaxID=28760 RepID=A0AAV9SMF2_9TELE
MPFQSPRQDDGSTLGGGVGCCLIRGFLSSSSWAGYSRHHLVERAVQTVQGYPRGRHARRTAELISTAVHGFPSDRQRERGVSLSGSIQPHVKALYSHSGLAVRDCSGPPGQWPGSRSADGCSLRAVDTAELGVNGVSPDTPGGPHSPNEWPDR